MSGGAQVISWTRFYHEHSHHNLKIRELLYCLPRNIQRELFLSLYGKVRSGCLAAYGSNKFVGVVGVACPLSQDFPRALYQNNAGNQVSVRFSKLVKRSVSGS
jgi:hypothetical protein